MKIGLLLTGHPPDELMPLKGRYDAYFRDLLDGRGFDFVTYSVVDMEFPESADVADGWLITGSKHGAYEDHPWIPPLEDLIREIHDKHLPLIGVCFGHQIIAQALGGKVEKFAGGWSIGPTEYELNGAPVTLQAWHQDQVVERPASATVIGTSDFCENAMLAYGDTIWTVQAHPEYDAEFIDGLIRTRGPGVVPKDQLDAAKARLDTPTDNAAIAATMADFFTQERPT